MTLALTKSNLSELSVTNRTQSNICESSIAFEPNRVILSSIAMIERSIWFDWLRREI